MNGTPLSVKIPLAGSLLFCAFLSSNHPIAGAILVSTGALIMALPAPSKEQK